MEIAKILEENSCKYIVKRGYKKKVATEIFGAAVYSVTEFVNTLNCGNLGGQRDKVFKLFADLLSRAAGEKIEEEYIWANLRLFVLRNRLGAMYIYLANGDRLKAKTEIFLRAEAVGKNVERNMVETLEEYKAAETKKLERKRKREEKSVKEEDDDDIPF